MMHFQNGIAKTKMILYRDASNTVFGTQCGRKQSGLKSAYIVSNEKANPYVPIVTGITKSQDRSEIEAFTMDDAGAFSDVAARIGLFSTA